MDKDYILFLRKGWYINVFHNRLVRQKIILRNDVECLIHGHHQKNITFPLNSCQKHAKYML